MEPPNSQPQYPLPLPSRVKLFKSILRVLVVSNVALGAYMFSKVTKKNSTAEETKSPKPPADEIVKESENDHVPAAKEEVDPYSDRYESIPEENLIFTPPVPSEPAKVERPLSQDQQRQLFEWMLEEKKKIMPKDHQEKKRINEEQVILERFIRADLLPTENLIPSTFR